MIEWEAHDAVDPFFRFHRAPDEEQILNDVPSPGRLCGIRITPVLVCSPMNAAKCRGIVLTSCVNKTRPARCNGKHVGVLRPAKPVSCAV